MVISIGQVYLMSSRSFGEDVYNWRGALRLQSFLSVLSFPVGKDDMDRRGVVGISQPRCCVGKSCAVRYRNSLYKYSKRKTMKISVVRSIMPCLIVVAALAGCADPRQEMLAAQAMSCTELAREIGRHEYRRDSARVDGVINSISSAIADDKKERDAADIESLGNGIDEMDASRSIEMLQKVYRSKRCA